MTIPPLSRRRLTEGLARPGIRLRRLPALSRIALGFLTLVVLLAVFAPLLAPHDPLDQQPQVDGTGAPPAVTGWGRTASAGTS